MNVLSNCIKLPTSQISIGSMSQSVDELLKQIAELQRQKEELNLNYNRSLLTNIVIQCFRQICLESFEQFFEDKLLRYRREPLAFHAYENLIRALRYLGGSKSSFNTNIFMTSSISGGGIHNDEATFIDFIGERAYNNIKEIGKGDISAGYALIQTFLMENYPRFANILVHLSETVMTNYVDGCAICPPIDSDSSDSEIKFDGVEVPYFLRSLLFQPSVYMEFLDYENVGIISPGGKQSKIEEIVWDEIESLYNPDLTGISS